MKKIHKYKAFISYSHHDQKFAKWVHKKIENYKIPKRLREKYPNLPKDLKRTVFLDDEELPTASALPDNLSHALESSELLIVIASPSATNSYWVDKEIAYFKKYHGEGKVLAIIKDGEPNATYSSVYDNNLEAFPKSLRYKVEKDGEITDERTEPLAADARNYKNRKKALIKLIAGILNVDFADLWEREKKEKRKRDTFIAIMIALFIALGVYGSYQYMGEKSNKELEQITKRIEVIEYSIRNETLPVEKVIALNKELDKLKIDKKNKETSLKALGKLTTSLGKKAQRAYQRDGAKQAIEVLESTKSLANQEARLKEISKEKLTLAKLYVETYELKKAHKSFKRATELFFDFENALSYSASFVEQGKYPKAIEILTKLLNIKLTKYEEIITLYHLNILYLNIGDFTQSDNTRKKIFTMLNHLTSHELKYLDFLFPTLRGLIYATEGENNKTEEILAESLTKQHALDYKNIDNESRTLLVLVGTYLKKNAYKKAKKALEKVLKMNHLLVKKTSYTYDNLAHAHEKLGNMYKWEEQYTRAITSYNSALKIRRKLAQRSHSKYSPSIASLLNNLGYVYDKMMLPNEAEKAHSEALNIMYTLIQKNYSTHKLQMIEILKSVGLFYQDKKQFDKAEKVYLESLEMLRLLAQKYPHMQNDDSLANILSYLGLLYSIQNKFMEAEEVYVEAVKIYRDLAQKNPNEYNIKLADTLYSLSNIYMYTKQIEKQENVLNESLKIFLKLPLAQQNINNTTIAYAFESLAHIYEEKTLYLKSEEYYGKALSIYRVLYKKNPAIYKTTLLDGLDNLGWIYKSTQQFNKAEELFKELLIICQQWFPKTSDVYLRTAQAYHALAFVYDENKQYTEAEKYYREALRIYRHLAQNNPSEYNQYIQAILHKLKLKTSIGDK